MREEGVVEVPFGHASSVNMIALLAALRARFNLAPLATEDARFTAFRLEPLVPPPPAQG